MFDKLAVHKLFGEIDNPVFPSITFSYGKILKSVIFLYKRYMNGTEYRTISSNCRSMSKR